ncbi:MAG: PAS domain-containing sensor histidine kinase [Bacteroidales bacterium]|nr:PAS domain-containing sensor histidine kinase [Bacteroidales bacterium]
MQDDEPSRETLRKENEHLKKRIRELEQKELEASEKYYQNIYHNIPVMLHSIDSEGKIIEVSNHWLETTGYQRYEVINRPSTDFLTEDSKQYAKNVALPDFFRKGYAKNVPYQLVKKNGEIMDVLLSAISEHDESGNFLRSIAVFHDITERKKAEASLRESEERYRTIVENTNDALIIHDFKGTITFANDNACQLLGYSREELLKTGLELIHSPNARPSIERTIKNEAWEEQILLETELISKQDLIIPVEISSKIISYKDEGEIQTFIRDITKRKQAEQALRESEEMFRTFVNHSSDGIRMADENGKIIFVNKAHEKITGYREDEVVGQTIWDFMFLLVPEARKNQEKYEGIKKGLTDVIKGRADYLFDQPYVINAQTRKGHSIYIQDIVFKIETSHGKRFGAILRDITQLKKQEEELRELNATKDKLFSIIAHDLRNPFNSILGFSELALKSIKNQNYDKLEKYCETVYQSARHSFDLLNNLLHWSRVQRGKMDFQPETLDMSSLLDKITELMKANLEEKNIAFSKTVEPDLAVYADRFMLETILRNLLSNAIKFTHNQGSIDIKAYREEKQTVVSVQDTGVGMPQETADKLFYIENTFSTPGTNKEKGNGLGLILCKEFVEQHGGKIWVESEVSRGSTFSFTIPFDNR